MNPQQIINQFDTDYNSILICSDYLEDQDYDIEANALRRGIWFKDRETGNGYGDGYGSG